MRSEAEEQEDQLMTQRSIAILVDTNSVRYRLKSWRSGSRKTSKPSRPAQVYEKDDDGGWNFLDSWSAATDHGKGLYTPKPDTKVLKEAINRIKLAQGVEIKEVILNTTNGWGTRGINISRP